MVIGLSKLIDPALPIVLDASVVINLASTGVAKRILDALPNGVVVVDTVEEDLSRNKKDQASLIVLASLVQAQTAELAKASDFTQGYFESLVAGAGPDTLDDGEAATIAYALECNAIPILDERKALRICRERYVALPTASTIDILSHPAVERVLGRALLADAVAKALDAHMRVLPDHIEWLVDLLGPEKLSTYVSIPASIRAALLKGN
jgi:predicted nucleic acid-binding protein